MNIETNDNKVFLQGTINSAPIFDHAVKDDEFYTFDLRVPRLSGYEDIIPITISNKLMVNENLTIGSKLALSGQFRSHNKIVDGKSKLILFVFCRQLHEFNPELNSNCIELGGYICKSPIYRMTPFNREICDLLMAVNRNYNKSDYIPCIAWGRNAKFVNGLPVGTRIEIKGRIQSREYNKMEIGVDAPVVKIAYEVSVSELNCVVNDN